MDFNLEAYDYGLPPERIAQVPAQPRDHSRLLVVKAQEHQHRHFYDLPDLLRPGDLLVLNDTQVLPARLLGRRNGGGAAEILLLHEVAPLSWEALVRPGRRLHIGQKVYFPQDVVAEMVAEAPEGRRQVRFELPSGLGFFPWLDQVGQMPLPPYITSRETSPNQYQTIWAKVPGAVAAPTAGLHFTADLLTKLAAGGIQTAHITLHVGLGTFRPVAATDIRQHTMHQEWLVVPPATVAQIQTTQRAGGRVIAVGTTVVRALESASQTGVLLPWAGWSELFIYPGYRWRTVEGLITNFHLPKSSLMMMVSALIGRERLLLLYDEAIRQSYRFYSFGDAMCVLPEA